MLDDEQLAKLNEINKRNLKQEKEDLIQSKKLKKGKHILTLKTIEKGNMNYDFIEFKKVL